MVTSTNKTTPAPERYSRLQVTLFLPPPVGPRINEIRATWDPAMARRIGSHVTVLRRVPHPDALFGLFELTSANRACRLRLAGIKQAPADAGGGIYIHVDDPHSDLDALRRHLQPAWKADPDAVQELAHVTLVHPRTTTPEKREQAWAALRSCDLVEDVVVPSLSLIGETDGGWVEVARWELARRHQKSR